MTLHNGTRRDIVSRALKRNREILVLGTLDNLPHSYSLFFSSTYVVAVCTTCSQNAVGASCSILHVADGPLLYVYLLVIVAFIIQASILDLPVIAENSLIMGLILTFMLIAPPSYHPPLVNQALHPSHACDILASMTCKK